MKRIGWVHACTGRFHTTWLRQVLLQLTKVHFTWYRQRWSEERNCPQATTSLNTQILRTSPWLVA
jgi:hypothetical protein